jgi:hypothetical protein
MAGKYNQLHIMTNYLTQYESCYMTLEKLYSRIEAWRTNEQMEKLYGHYYRLLDIKRNTIILKW